MHFIHLCHTGVFGTVEMNPPTVGTWLVEDTIGDYQLAGMRAKLLVYNPRRCSHHKSSKFPAFIQLLLYFVVCNVIVG